MLTAPKSPSLKEVAKSIWRGLRSNRDDLSTSRALRMVGPAAVISSDPLVIYSAVGAAPTLGMAGMGRRLPSPAVILLGIHGSIEWSGAIKSLRRAAVLARMLDRRHRIIFLCNTEVEASMLTAAGEQAIFLNHNLLLSDADFYPIAEQPLVYDAVYNARLNPQKRHELTLEIERCAMIFMRTGMETQAYQDDLIARHNRQAPGHHFVNTLRDGVPVFLDATAVNRIYNRSAVGLALSETEGAMYASIEYLFSGLPVVSTPNRGGRDVYFDPDFCITAEPDPRQIRDAVIALRERNIPRQHIRERTLAKVRRDRTRFLDLLQEIVGRDYGGQWPFRSKIVEWKPWTAHLSDVAAGRLTALQSPQ